MSILEKDVLAVHYFKYNGIFLAQYLITNSLPMKQPLSPAALQRQREPLGTTVSSHLGTMYSISLSKERTHQYWSVILSDRDEHGAESPNSEGALCIVMHFTLISRMNMNGLNFPNFSNFSSTLSYGHVLVGRKKKFSKFALKNVLKLN